MISPFCDPVQEKTRDSRSQYELVLNNPGIPLMIPYMIQQGCDVVKEIAWEAGSRIAV